MKKTTTSRFAKSFEKDKQLIRDQVQLAARNLAVAAYAQIVSESPIWAGDYILSHRIGIDKESDVPPIDTRLGFEAQYSDPENSHLEYVSEAAVTEKKAMVATAAAQMNLIETAKAFEKIHISNDNAHALAVEKTGTPRNPIGYQVYDRTAAALEAQGSRIANVTNKIYPEIHNRFMTESSDPDTGGNKKAGGAQ